MGLEDVPERAARDAVGRERAGAGVLMEKRRL